MTAHHGTHSDLHSEQGALRGEHPGRAANPTIKVRDLAWLEFQKPDLAGSERFAHAFGFTTVSRTADELQLRGTDSGGPCVIVRRGPRAAGDHPRAVIDFSSLTDDEITTDDCAVSQVLMRNPSVLTGTRYDDRTYPHDAAQ